MFKILSAALLAVSVLAAPAFAATSDKMAQAPVTKSTTLTKSTQVKKNPLNANAKMNHRHHVRHHSHRSHNKMTVGKVHKSAKVAAKPVTRPAKRG
jgi:hypothetical protein